MKKVILSGKGIVKTFGENTVLHGIDIDVCEGDFTVIMGSSGSGKSTLLYALSGMDRISGGELFYRDRNIANASEKELTLLRANDFGFVFQHTHLIGNLTLTENIRMAALIGNISDKETQTRANDLGFVFQRTHLINNLTLGENIRMAALIGNVPDNEAKSRADELITRMNLVNAKDRLPSQVSGGEAQRAAVARAVITKPAVLFADEPTGALNKANSEEVLDLFSSLNAEGQTVLLVTHDKEAALRGNRVLYLEDGTIIGELELPNYTGKDKAREEKLTAWLEGLGW